MDELKAQYMTPQYTCAKGAELHKGCDQPAWRDHSGHQPAAENGTFR